MTLDREQFLIKQHEAEMDAMAKIQVDQVNDHLEIILQLQKENEPRSCSETDLPSTTRQKIALLQQPDSSNDTFHSSTSRLCITAQVKQTKIGDFITFTH
jgi:hypothetical protein